MKFGGVVAPTVIGLVLLLPGTTLAGEGQWPDISTPVAVTPAGGRDAAVVIALENYVFLPKVPGAGKNGTDWYTFLVDGRKVPGDRVHLLRDKDATREQILDEVKHARSEVQAGGMLWFVFIGHGAPSETGDDGVLIGSDAQQTASSITARGVAQGELARALEPAPGTSSVALLDACFSGQSGNGGALAQGLQPVRLIHADAARLGNVTWMTAGTASQYAGSLPGLGRPAFSYLVLGALRGWGDEDHDGRVTGKEAVGFARKVLNIIPTGRTQTPEVHGPNAESPLTEGGAEHGPKLSDLMPSEERTPVGLKRDAPSPTNAPSARIAFRAPTGDDVHWSLRDAAGNGVCTLPCEAAVPIGGGYSVRRDAALAADTVQVYVPDGLVNPGAKASMEVVPKTHRWAGFNDLTGVWVIGGGVALAGGGVMTAVGAAGSFSDPREKTSWLALGIGTMGAGALVGSLGLWLMYKGGHDHEAHLQTSARTVIRMDAGGLALETRQTRWYIAPGSVAAVY